MAPEQDDGIAVPGGPSGRPAGAEQRARELLRTASHDLRSPLAAIQLIVQRMERLRRDGGDGAQWTTALERISNVVSRALVQVEEVLSADRLAGGAPASAGARPVDVEEVIEEAITLQREALEAARCAVTVTRRAGLVRAQGSWNRSCLLRIFSNLLQNASKYAPASPIHVELARAGDRLKIAFADRGPGIRATAEATGKYLDDGVAPAGAHGLGIWIVRRGVAELNGRLKIRNAPGMGLAFAIELPGLAA
ncbi:MAG TPA: HAMP domain-containing sensor histidine kinase [Polyangia bacterium]|nr:HAMP domain-containing sensor histidine kinase [Polyangia bacterium]